MDLHPKVIRQGPRLAFLAPDLTRTALDGTTLTKLNKIPKLLTAILGRTAQAAWIEIGYEVL
jgi:hypothetical protein